MIKWLNLGNICSENKRYSENKCIQKIKVVQKTIIYNLEIIIKITKLRSDEEILQ